MQIQLLQNHSHHPEALDVYRQLCEAPSALDPPPRGVAAGVTGRLAAGQSIGYLTRLCDDADAVPLICQSLESWLLKVPFLTLDTGPFGPEFSGQLGVFLSGLWVPC